jgi:indolepyruvate ferredoxin oxidoreductase beta subunit
MAEELGNPKVMNVILLGALVKNMGITDVNWEKVISENVKPKFVELNLKAFKKGMEM